MVRDSLCHTTTSETEYIHRDNKINLKPMETERDANIIHITQGVSSKKLHHALWHQGSVTSAFPKDTDFIAEIKLIVAK